MSSISFNVCVFITLDLKRYGDNISLFTHEVTQTTSDVVKTLDYIIQMMTGIRAEEGIFYKLYLLKDIFNSIYLLRKIYLGNILSLIDGNLRNCSCNRTS